MVVIGRLIQRRSHNRNIIVLADPARKSYDQSPIARQHAPDQK